MFFPLKFIAETETSSLASELVWLLYVLSMGKEITTVKKVIQILGGLNCPLEVDFSLLTKAALQDNKLGTLHR